MKIKSLQINVLALMFGLTSVCFINKIDASNATKSPEKEQFFDQNGDDSPNKNQKPTKQGAATEPLNWTFRGPDDAAGKVTSVVSNSSDYLTVYVGAAHNGVWKSVTGGQGGGTDRWNKIPVESNKNLYVTCLALDETNNILYVGTGGDFTGQGIYKSEGGGALKLMAGTENWTHVSKIAFSGNRIYAATNEGLMCYTGGAWTTCSGTKPDEPVTLDGPIRDVSINSAGLVIVAMNKVECYISKDGAPNKFEYIELGVSKYYEDNISVATSPSDNNVLYVVSAKLGADAGKLYKALLSEDQGATWEPILTYFSGKEFIDPLDGNGTNINNIFVDPVDPYMLYVVSKNIWKGKRYGSGAYDFGLSAISSSSGPAADISYLHSNIRDVNFFASYGDYAREAYVATDGGLYKVSMYISLYSDYTIMVPLNKYLMVGSYDNVCVNNKNWLLAGTPTLGVQAIGDPRTNYDISARPLWDVAPAAKNEISEGSGGACVMSSINDDFYAYSLLLDGDNGLTLTFRRSIDYGLSFHPMKNSNPTVEWLSSTMLPPTTTVKYNAPMVMWESFADDYTPDTVWFKANRGTNFDDGDRIIYAPSKNANYPIEYAVPYGFAHGDSILVPDPVQNRMFIGLNNKLFMTREALNYEKTSTSAMPMEWFQIETLPSADSITVLALSDDANTLYAGARSGNVYRVTNLKQVYNTATIGLAERTLANAFTGKKIRAIAVDPTDANHIVVVLEGGGDNVYETFNGEAEPATFTSIKGGLPNNVYSVLFPKGAKKGNIIAGTEKGIWTKESSGTWEANNKGMGEVPVMTLTQITTYRSGVKNVPFLDPNDGKIRINYPNNSKTYLTIYAGTYGSGIFSTEQYVGIDEFPSNDLKESDALVVTPNPVTDIATIELDTTKGRATIQVFGIDGRCIKEQTAKNNVNTINLKEYASGTYIIQVTQGGSVKSAKVIKQ